MFGTQFQLFHFLQWANFQSNFEHHIKQVKPKYFLLENVRMKKEFIEIISQQVSECYPELPGTDLFDNKIEPILINSALLSAQSRQRLYWTNIPNIRKPKDKGIMLSDILEDDVRHPVYSNIYGGYGKSHMIHKYKAPTLKVGGEPPFATLKKYVKDHLPDNYITFNKAHIRLFTARECERLQTVPDDYTAGVSKPQRYKMLGNGWTIDILSTIFKNLQGNPKPLKKIKQLKLL